MPAKKAEPSETLKKNAPAESAPAPEPKPAARKTSTKKAAPPAAEEKKETAKKTAPKKASAKKAAPAPADEKKAPAKKTAAKKPAAKRAPKARKPAEETAPAVPGTPEETLPQPRRSVAFIGSECYPFVKTGGLGDVMYALPRALSRQNCDVKVILPRYKCIPWEYQEKMIYRGEFHMDLCADGRSFYVGIMEYVWDGVVYDFIDNEDFFSYGNPYTNLVDDIPRYCFFSKAALAALNYMDWIPDVIHCHDWQAALVPVYLRTLFEGTPVGGAKTVLTIHNLRFQGVYNIPTIRYWTGLPDYVFNKDALKQGYDDANLMKGGLAYTNMITTVSGTYAGEIQTPSYGDGLDAHLRYHSGKLRGIVNGIDCELWDSAADPLLAANYGPSDAVEKKRLNKRALQEQLGLEAGSEKSLCVIGSRLYYLSPQGPCVYAGDAPALLSESFGTTRYSAGRSGTDGRKWYLSMIDEDNGGHLFVYDTSRGLWVREDGLRPVDFAWRAGDLYALGEDGNLWILGRAVNAPSAATDEGTVSWLAEFGDIMERSPDKKRITKLQLRLTLEENTGVRVLIRYDSENDWRTVGELSAKRKRSAVLPVTPRRLDHFRVRIEGTGACRISSLTYETTGCSDR